MHVFMVVHVFGLLKIAIVVADSDNFVKVLSPKSCSLSWIRAWWVSTIRLIQIYFYSHIMTLLAWQVYRRGDQN